MPYIHMYQANVWSKHSSDVIYTYDYMSSKHDTVYIIINISVLIYMLYMYVIYVSYICMLYILKL